MKKIFTLLTLLLTLGGASSVWATPTTIFNAADAGWASATLTEGTTTVGDVTWYGRNSVEINSDSHEFADGTSFTKYLKTAGNSTFKTGSTLAAVFTYTPTEDGTLKVYCKGGGSGERYIYISQSITSTNRDESTAIASFQAGDGTNANYGILEAFVEKDKMVYIWDTNNILVYGMTFEASNSDLALSSTSGVTGVSASTSFTYTTSSTGTVTVASSDVAIATATVNTATNTVTVTGVAAGTATITVTQDADASYGKGVKKFTVTINAPVSRYANTVTPTGILDLSDADAMSTMLNGAWNATYGRALFGNDGSNNIVTFSVVGAYSSTAEQTWVGAYSSGSTGQSWDATGVFKGSSAYMTTAKAATTKSNAGLYSFRVKGASKVQALVSSRNSTQKVIMAAYAYSGSTLAETTILYEKYGSGDDIGTLTLNLNAATEYLITISADGTSTNSRLYEMALFFDESVTWTVSGTISASGWNTFSSNYKLDLSTISGGAAYVATATSGSSVTLTPTTAKVNAGEGLMIKGNAGDDFTIAVTADDATLTGDNLLVGLPTGGTVAKNNNNYVFGWATASDPGFYLVNDTEPVLGAGKAYLHTTAALGARLYFNFEDEATGINDVRGNMSDVRGEYFDLQGRKVAQPTKGLYIVNGKKVVIK